MTDVKPLSDVDLAAMRENPGDFSTENMVARLFATVDTLFTLEQVRQAAFEGYLVGRGPQPSGSLQSLNTEPIIERIRKEPVK